METLYDLLGALPRDDADELRVAFRRAVKGAHPDLNPDDPDAGVKFRQIVRASQILGDTDQRVVYDHLLDLADHEQRQIKKRAVAHTIYQAASGVIAFSVALAAITGGYLAVMQMPDEWIAQFGQVSGQVAGQLAGTLRQSTEIAASTLRQSTETAVSALRQSTEAVTSLVIPSPPAPAMASTETKIADAKLAEPASQVAPPAKTEAKTEVRTDTKTDAPAKSDNIELPPPAASLPTVVTLQTEIGASPRTSVGPPLDITQLDARTYREHGIIAYRNGDLDAAIADFDQAIQLDPKSSSAYIDRGIVFYRLRKFDRAFADIARAKRIDKTATGKSTQSSPSTTAQPSTKKPRPVVELSQPSPPRRHTANLDASREEGFLFRRQRDY
jgi:tetratricopeptide (TPR) repeat protein